MEAVIHHLLHRQVAGPVHGKAALVKDVVDLNHAALLMGCSGDAAAQMGHHEVALIVGLAQHGGSLAGHAAMVEGVDEADALHLGKAGDTGHIGQLVHRNGVYEISGNVGALGQFPGQQAAQIGGVLLAGMVKHLVHHVLIDAVGTGYHRFGKAAASRNCLQLGQREARLIQSGADHGKTIVQLIQHAGEGRQIGRCVADGFGVDGGFILINRNFRGSRTGVNDQNFHNQSPPAAK